MPAAVQAWHPVYRQLLREGRRLPDETARLHFRKEAKRTLRLKRDTLYDAHALLRKLQLANAGYLVPLQQVLGRAFGREGEPAYNRVHSLMEEAKSKDVPPLVPGINRTRPPVYTDRLKAYLTSSLSHRTGKAPREKQLDWPPTLPERADPKSDEARLIGPLSKKREANIRWRYLRGLEKRLFPPFKTEELDKLEKLVLKPADLQRDKADTKLQLSAEARQEVGRKKPKDITPRFMQRRYQEILNSGPILTQMNEGPASRWHISRPAGAREHGARPKLSAEDRQWLSR